MLRDVGSVRRGRPKTAALRQKSVRVLRDVGSIRRGQAATPDVMKYEALTAMSAFFLWWWFDAEEDRIALNPTHTDANVYIACAF